MERVNATVTHALQESARSPSEVNEVNVIQEDSDEPRKVTDVFEALLGYMKNLTLAASGVKHFVNDDEAMSDVTR